MTINWNASLVGQLDFYWQAHLRPRLEGLTDEEYFWEPADGCWSLRRRDDGKWRSDWDDTQRPAGPVTTIAWRMAHIAIGVFETRFRAFFGGEGPTMFDPQERILAAGDLPASAEAAIAYLTGAYTRWRDAIAGLNEEQLAAPLGPKGADFAEFPMADLVLHLNRETMHHGGEIGLLRDLYLATGAATRHDRLLPHRR